MVKALIGPGPQKLTVDEIRARYPNEWVVLTDCDCPNMELTAGSVYAHHPDRDVLEDSIEVPNEAAVIWTGQIVSPLLWLLARHVDRPV